jgi:hypothetical protein
MSDPSRCAAYCNNKIFVEANSFAHLSWLVRSNKPWSRMAKSEKLFFCLEIFTGIK